MTSPLPFLARLALDERARENDIRRAYARELKLIDQASQPQQFQALRQAYEAALAWCRQMVVDTRPDSTTAAPPDHAPATAPVTADATGAVTAAWLLPAAAAFAAFQDALRGLTAGSQAAAPAAAAAAPPPAPWAKLLQDTLAGTALQNLHAAAWFEQQVAQLLADGWRAGHEQLFVTAMREFGWDDQRTRLRAMGNIGQQLDDAIIQYQDFQRLSAAHGQRLHDAIARLRDPAQPTQYEASYILGELPALLLRYPQWLPMVTDTSNLHRWRALGSQFPPARVPPPAPPLPEAASTHARSGLGWGGWGLALMALYVLMTIVRSVGYSAASSPATDQPARPSQVDTPRAAPAPAVHYDRNFSPVPPQREVQQYLRQRIGRHFRYLVPPDAEGNPTVSFKIALTSTGELAWLDNAASSGVPAFDLAVRRAIEETAPFEDAIPREMLLAFSMK